MKKRICAILILMMLLLNSSVMILISEAVEAVNDAVNATVSNVDLKLNADYLVNNVENNVQLTATLKTDDTGYSLFKNPSISIEMPAEITDVVIETPFLMYNNQVFTITNSEVITNESGNKVINVKLEGQQTEYETDSILEGTNIVIPATIIVSKQIDTMVSNIKLRYTNEIEGQTIYEANGEDCETEEITLINKIIRNLPAMENDEDAKTIEFEQQGIKVEIIEMLGNSTVPDNGTLYEQQIVKHVVRFTNNAITAQPVNFTANIPSELTYAEFLPTNIVYNEQYDSYYIPEHPRYRYDDTKKQVNINIEELGIGETKETYFEFKVNDLTEVKEKVISINYELKTSNGQTGRYNISNTIKEAEIKAELQCYRLSDRNDWQYALMFTNITDKKLTNINVHCEIDMNFNISEIFRFRSTGNNEKYDLNNVQYNTFIYSIDSLEPGEQCYIAVNGTTKDIYENDATNTYEMKGVYKVYGDEINTYISNETTVTAGIEKVKVSMTSEKDGQSLRTDDEITYTINIENIGNKQLAMSKYSLIRVFDFIPEDLAPISATYNNFIVDTQYINEIIDYRYAPLKVETYTEEQKTLDLTTLIISEGATEEETPNIDLNLSIPYGEKITIVIKAKVKMVVEKTDMTNTVTVEGNSILTKTASVKHTLLPYDYDETQQPETPEEPENPELDNIGGGTIEDSENPGEPSQPEEPSEVNVTGVELIPSETKLKVGQSTNLIATVLPENATNKAVTWSSSDESVAKIVNGTVMALKEGTATITVTTEDGNKTATSTIIVENNNEETTGIPVTGIQVTPSGATILVGNTVKLRAAVIPSNATNKKVTWSSSNTDVATVDSNGLVTGIEEGTTTITVTTEDGNKTATCNITVQNINEENPTDPENPDQPTNPDDPTNPENPNQPTTPENPSNPTDPENPTNPDNPDQPVEEKVSVSGTAWIDTNENGKRDKEEQKYSNMTVMLYNYGTKKLVSSNGIAIEKKTDENGKYEFTDLEKGKYIVIFWYDTNKYELTGYQKAGVSSSENSDAISKNVTLIGEKKVAGLTDIMNLEKNIENIDIGLVENKEFDFSIQKYINKITVQTNKGTKTYTYNNKNFAKIEIHSKEIEGAQVIIEYKMVVKNEGELPGKVDLIVDEIPSNLNFHSELNNSWYKTKDGICTTALSGESIGVGESREITIVLTKNINGNNVGSIANTAKIGSTSNDKGIEEEKLENNSAKAEVLITISTGIIKWIGLIILTIIILGIIAFIVLKDKKLIKTITFIFIVGICMIGNTTSVYGYTVDGLTCVTPGLKMCQSGPHDHVEIGHSETSRVLASSTTTGNTTCSLSDSTNKSNVQMTVSNDKIKVGPFKISASNGASWSSGEVTYKYLDADGVIKTGTQSFSGSFGNDIYIELPKNTVQVVKINVSGSTSYTIINTYSVTYTVVYQMVALGTCADHGHNENGCCICSGSPMQQMAGTYTDVDTDTDTGTASGNVEIAGPWTVPGNIYVEKLAKDAEGAAKTYIPNVGVKVTKGTDISASQYLTLYNSNGTIKTKIDVGEILTLSGYNAYSGDPSTVTINGTTYNVKWNKNKANGTELVLTKGKVTIKNVKSGIKYTAIENSNPNYGYEQVINKDTKGSSSTVNSAHYTSKISIYNKKSTGALVIKKVDKDDSSVILPNVQFVIKAKKNSTEKGYIKIIADESTNVTKFTNSNYAQYVKSYGRVKDMTLSANAPISYVSNPEDATKFVTGSDGKVTINNLEGTMLKEDGTASTVGTQYYYKAEEYWNPNYGYSKENYYGYGLTEYKADTTNSWKVDTKTGWKLVPSAWPSDTSNANKSYSTSYQVTLTNQKLTGNIRINKFDAEGGNNVKLQHIGFVLKAELLGESSNNFNITGKYIKVKIDKGTQSKDSNGYAKYTRGNVRIADGKFDGKASDVMTFVDNPKDATVFYTDENGKILIANLLSGTNGENYINYTIEEYDSKTYGYVAEIGEGYTNATLDKTHVVTPTVLSFTKTKTNTPDKVDNVNIGNYKQTGNLTIYKRDNEQPTKLEQATFVLKAKLKQNGVLVEKYVKAIIDIDNTIKGNSVTIDSNGYAKELVGMGRIRDITNSLGTTNEPTSIKFVDDIKDATKFTTNYNGSISIANLLMSTNGVDYISYYLQEVENDNYGYSGVSNEYTVEYETKDGWFAVNRKKYQETTGIYAENYTSTSQGTITPYIPEGFRHLEGDLNSGYVIMDGDGNQYVWIEVPKTLEVYKTSGLDIKEFTESECISIENDLHRYTNIYRESSYCVDEYGEDLEGNSPTGLTSNEYYEQKKTMLKSIYKYGGFYVGRYETGVKNGDRTSAGETTQEPAIRPNAYPYNFVTCSQAQNLASSFASNGYTSSLMYGVQWDLILKYLENKVSTQAALTEDSTDWGNYRNSRYTIANKMAKYSTNYGTSWHDGAYGIKNTYDTVLLSTGANTRFMMKNIYDLAGNLEEWTLEQYKIVSEDSYTLRGGSFASGYNAVSARNPSEDSGMYNTGFRVVLYKNDEIVEEVEKTKPYIPEGTSHVAGTDLNTGYVIQDAKGNQYVWVEVPKTKDVYQTAGLTITSFTEEEYAKIEKDLHTYTNTYRNGTTYLDEYREDAQGNSATGLTKDQYYEQKKKMLKSIYKNGGFYVGRYETGIDYSEGLHSGNATQTPVIKQNKYPYFKLTASQAQSLSSSFASKGYTSSLMFGVQWDLILKYLESKNAVTQNELISNSMSWGNYAYSSWNVTNSNAKYSNGGPGSISAWKNAPYQTSSAFQIMLSTGASDTFSKQNISDLAGNVYEYTLEIMPGNGHAVARGGHFYDSGDVAANDRGYDGHYDGFRVSLYKDEGTGSDETMKTRFSSITVKNKKQTMNLQLNKVDIDSTTKKLERVTFVVKANLNGEFSNKYIRIIPDNNSNTYALKVTGSVRIADKLYTSNNTTPCVDFVDNIEDATYFETDKNGQISIQNLIMSTDGINRIQYMFEEVKNDHYGYVADGSNAAVRFDTQTRNDPSTETKYSFDRQSSLQTKEKTGVITYGEHILVKNIKQTANLYINKGDYEQFDDVKLEKVTFIVKAHLEGNSDIDGKYIRIMPDKADSYANKIEDEVRVQDKIYDKETEQNQSPLLFVNKNNATKFVTNDEGKIIIMNLLMSTNGKDHIQYSFEEIENDNYGYVADGTNTTLRHAGQSVDTLQQCKYTIPIQPSIETINAHTAQREKYPINLRNVKQTGNLQINKIDFDDYSALTEEVTFAIKAHLNGNGFIDEKYIKIIADPNVYQQNVTNKNDGYVDIAKDIVRIKDQCYNYDNIKESVVFVNNYDDATKFVTGSDGNLTIMNLIMSTNGKNRITYTFEELKNDNYGYVAEKGQYNNYTLRYPSQEINVRKEVPQTIERQSSIETLNKANVVQEFFIKNIKQTGNIVITKTDITSGEKLANVEFVLKAFNDQNMTHESNEYYGIDGKYVKATIETLSDGEVKITDIIYVSDIKEATKFKTNAEGKLIIYNLLMSTNGADLIRYHLVETKNPNYGYLADTEYFEDFRVTFEPQNGSEMLDDYLIVDRQIKQETDGKTSENDTVLTIKNEQIYTRLSGMVWEDIAGGKANAIDNQYIDAVYNNAENSLEGDALIEGIVVYLYKDGKLVTTTTTDENGYYMFGTYHENGIYENADYWNKNNGKDVVIPGRNGDTLTSTAENENGNIVIKDLSKYHIEFEYDGLRFTTVKPFETENNATEVINSNGIEVESNHKDKKDRIQRDKDFEIIKNDEGRKFNEDGTPKDVIEGWAPGYNLEYNSDKPQNHQAQYIDHWTYSANGNISEDGANNPYGANTSGKKYFKLAKNEVEDYAVVSAVKNIAWKDEYVIGDTIPYINQGLYRRELPDLAIATDIKETEIIVDGYKNTYTYEKRDLLGDIGEKSDGFGIEVKYGNTAGTSYSSRGLNTYTRPLYASDLVYNLTSDDELMEVYITYQIVVKNQADTLRARVNEIINYYDSRYEIVNVTGATYDPNKVYKDVNIAKNVGENVEGEVKYNKVILTLGSDTEIIEHGEKQEIITIKFKLNPDALRAIAYEKATLYNVSEITSFTSYYGDDTYCAEHQKASEKGRSNSENPMLYAGIDTDSAPNSAVIRAERRAETKEIDVNRDGNRQNYLVEKVTLTNESLATFEDDTDQAPSLILGIDEEDPIRGLTGIVFEDNGIFTDEEGNKISEDHTNKTVHTAQHRLGNGIYDEGENIIKDAKIELYRVDNNGNPEEKRTQLYKLKIDAVNKKAEIVTEACNAITWSEDTISRWSEDPENPLYDKTYNYKFMGVLPGKYLIRYSYGNFEQDNPDEDKFLQKDKITQIVDSTGALDIVDVLDYKSTIITSDTITTALDLFGTPYDRIGDLDWILGEKQADGSRQNIVRYSDAVDDLDKRKEIDGDNREVYFDRESKRKVISADTAAFEVGVEYKEVNEDKVTQTMYDDEFILKDGKVVRLPQFSIISPYQDFGIIERARTDIYVDKTISNLRIVLSTGQELINGDPYKEKITYIKALQMNDDIRKDRSKLIYAEIDNELVQGATLYLKYDITVHNDSEIDYLYNDVAGKEFYYYGKIKDVTRVDQGIFKVVDYMDSKLVFDEQLSKDGSWKKVKLEELTGEKSDYDNGKRFISEDVEQCLEKNSYTMLVTSAFENVEAGTSKTINAYASKLLAVGEEEFAFENHVAILHTKGLRETKDTDPGNYIPEDPYPDPVIPDGPENPDDPGNEQDDDWIKVIITPPTGLPLSKIKE